MELYIDTITNKANNTLSFLRRNLKIGNKKTKCVRAAALKPTLKDRPL